MIKITTNKYEGLNERQIKKLRNIEIQLIKELKENGYIEVEKSEIRNGVYYYFKKLKSGKKSSISIYLLETEIKILKDEKNELLEEIETYQQEKTYLRNEIEEDKSFIPEINKKTIIKNIDGKFVGIIITNITFRGISFEILDTKNDYSNVSGFRPNPVYYKEKEVK